MHAESDVAVIAHGRKADPPTARRIFHRVIEQVVDDLLESRFIASERRKIVRQRRVWRAVSWRQISFPNRA